MINDIVIPIKAFLMKKSINLLVLLLIMAIPALTQTATDALRYSWIFYNGTSRFVGTGGAYGAVGADFSVLATNPAGLGLYRTSEFTFSPTFLNRGTISDYNGYSARDYKLNFAMGNFGFVYTFFQGNQEKAGGLRSLTVGFGMNRQNNFHNRVVAQGPNHSSSMLNQFTEVLNNKHTNPNNVRFDYPFDIGLAYDCGLIYYDSLQKRYFCDMPNGGVTQGQIIETRGSINEFDLSLGGNIADKLYFGITMGIPNIRYFYRSSYWEEDTGDSIPYFKYFQYNYNVDTRGTGLNFKVGVIYRPANWFRIGAAIHTPTWYPTMMDIYASNMYAVYDSVLSYPNQYSPNGYYEYEMKTPFRAIGSIAFFIGKHGFISGEYEYVNYSEARMRAPGDNFTDVNTNIETSYTSPLNFRVGTEWRIKMFRIRGGFRYYGSPDNDVNYGNLITINGGFGIFIRRFFVDFAYQWSQTNQDYTFYNPSLVNPVNLKMTTHIAQTTFGFKF
jgi:hypothetical protein